MGRENKRASIAALHREQILNASEKLFYEKGYVQTTIDDISKASKYSRRTIYIYYENKDDILHHVIEKGLQTLKSNIENAVNNHEDFIACYQAICMAMSKYQKEYPHSMDSITHSNTANIDVSNASDTVKHILHLGTEINSILEAFIESGKERGIVRQDVVPMLTVYVLWSSINALLTLVHTKGQFIGTEYAVSEAEFLDYGFKQIINSILEIRI